MRFILVESLEKATPYMLRNDGSIIKCGRMHPYIMKDAETVDEIIRDGIDLDALYWFYKNTGKERTRKNIRAVANYFIDRFGIDPKFSISIYDNEDTDYDFGIDDTTYMPGLGEINSFVEITNNDTNQEFCRVRTSDKLWGGSSKDIYFRISSVGFNWFPTIWEFVYKNKNQIDTITVCKDSSVFGGSFEPYKIGSDELYLIPVDDFIMSSGNPIIESIVDEGTAIGTAQKRLSNGSSVSEAFDWMHPRHANSFYKKIVKTNIDSDRCNLLHK